MTTEYPAYQYSMFVGPPGKGDQLVIRAGTAGELAEQLSALTDALDDDPSVISEVLNSAKAIHVASDLIFPAPAQPAPSAAPASAAPASNGGGQAGNPPNGTTRPCPKCQGTLTFRAGQNRTTGKPYAGWFCSSNDRTHSEFPR